jgi:hypothetical protein
MTNKRKPTPKTQQELSFENGTSYLNTGKVPYIDKKERIEQVSVKGDTFKNVSIGIKDIDEAILYYFNNIIQPSVVQNGQKINVPVLYGSPERWSSVQKDGYYRDKNGKIQAPLIMFKRDNLTKKRNLGNKLDSNQASNYYIYKSNYNRRNIYDKFSTLSNRTPSEEYYAVIIPDFVTVQYSCIVFTDYVEQNNKLIESINFASDSYWGNPERFKFRSMIDSYNTITELIQGQDRGVKTTFTITLDGYIIPDSINKELASIKKFYSKSRIDFRLETEGSVEILGIKAKTPEREAKTRFFDQPITGTIGTGTTGGALSPTELNFILIRKTALADNKTGQIATFLNKSFVDPPINYPALGIEDFEIYINGRRVPSSFINSITEVGSSIEVSIDTDGFFEEIGIVLRNSDEVLIVGKIQ